MKLLTLNLQLMLFWLLLTTQFNLLNLLTGFGLGWLVLFLIQPLYGKTTYFRKPYDILCLISIFIYELFTASLEVLWDIVTPEDKSQPGILAIPLDVHTETQILLLSSFLSLTPGSLTIDLSQDRKTLYIHHMFIGDEGKMIQMIKNGIERRVLKVTEG